MALLEIAVVIVATTVVYRLAKHYYKKHRLKTAMRRNQ